MDHIAFRASPDVAAFLDWMATRHRTLSIDLDIKSSRFVPGGIRTRVTGLDALLGHYRWQTLGSKEGDWAETRQGLKALGAALRQAIDRGDEAAALDACGAILAWGGNRNWQKGAYPYLAALHAQRQLVPYLEQARQDFALAGAIVDGPRPQAAKMNSMLTKVHALAATDGLPIYDSRVAAAIAALVEAWRRATGRASAPLPAPLVFPATMADRSVLHLFAGAEDPGAMSYAPQKTTETAKRWSSAKIRLGWLMQAILDRDAGLFAKEAPDRMHAFEASLFMIGYDVACLRANFPDAGCRAEQRTALQQAGRRRLRRDHADLARTTTRTLGGTKDNIAYAGDIDAGISGVWGTSAFAFDSDFLQDLLANFAEQDNVGLGACRDGAVAPDTIGSWIDAHYPGKSRMFASLLGAILVNEGLAQRRTDLKGIRLRFH